MVLMLWARNLEFANIVQHRAQLDRACRIKVACSVK